jgi:pimeloyl-ACP methyl ester carboxylesterase
MSVTASRSTGRSAGTGKDDRHSSCTAARALAAVLGRAASSTLLPTGSWCSISAGAGNSRPLASDADADRLDGIPGALIQGAHDVSCPLDTAWDLAKQWTTAELTIVDAGHGSSRTTPDAFPAAVTAALDRLALTTAR